MNGSIVPDEIAERDAAVDHQALDLVEHRHVRRVGGVLPEHAPRHDRVDRRWLRLHHPDLHRRGVRAQHDAPGLAEVDVERVPHAPGRVLGRHVERGEVVPVGLDLGAFAHGEAHADEHVLEMVVGLGDEVEVPASGTRRTSVRSSRSARDAARCGRASRSRRAAARVRRTPGRSLRSAPARPTLRSSGSSPPSRLLSAAERRALAR